MCALPNRALAWDALVLRSTCPDWCPSIGDRGSVHLATYPSVSGGPRSWRSSRPSSTSRFFSIRTTFADHGTPALHRRLERDYPRRGRAGEGCSTPGLDGPVVEEPVVGQSAGRRPGRW